MKSGLKVLLALFLVIIVFYLTIFLGGLKGIWYEITNPSFDPYSSEISQKRVVIENKIVSDFVYLDFFPPLVKYGTYNTDICEKLNYSWKNPIRLTDHLHKCNYISQRYYGFDREYESTVRELIDFITTNNEGLVFQPQDVENLFIQKEWVSNPAAVEVQISEYNLNNTDTPASNITDVISYLEGQLGTNVIYYSKSNDGYAVQLEFFDWGTSPTRFSSSNTILISADTPDQRQEYVIKIKDEHSYGVVVTTSYNYYKK